MGDEGMILCGMKAYWRYIPVLPSPRGNMSCFCGRGLYSNKTPLPNRVTRSNRNVIIPVGYLAVGGRFPEGFL
jgi:hypothetical protein